MILKEFERKYVKNPLKNDVFLQNNPNGHFFAQTGTFCCIFAPRINPVRLWLSITEVGTPGVADLIYS